MQSSQPNLADYGLFALVAGLYGAVFIFISMAVETLPPLTVVAGRQLLTGLVFLLVAYGMQQGFAFAGAGDKGTPLSRTRIWLLILGSALFGNSLPFFLTSWGQQEVDAGLAAILISTSPLITVFLAHFFTVNEKLNRYKILGVLFGFLGVVWLIGLPQSVGSSSEWGRQLAIFGSACCFAINLVLMRSLVHLPRIALIATILIVSFLMIAPFSIILDQPWTLNPSVRSVFAVILLGLLAGGLGNILSFALVARQGAGFVSMTNYVIPVMAMFWAWLFLSEYPSKSAWIALGLILAGLAIVRLGSHSKNGFGMAKAPELLP